MISLNFIWMVCRAGSSHVVQSDFHRSLVDEKHKVFVFVCFSVFFFFYTFECWAEVPGLSRVDWDMMKRSSLIYSHVLGGR